MVSSFRVSVPGKAMLAGEYAVLVGAPGLVAAVDRSLIVDADEAPRFSIEGAGRLWEEGRPEEPALSFALAALAVSRFYLEGLGESPRPLSLRITDSLRAPSGQKLGLGGSAGVTVGVSTAVLDAAGRPPDRSLLFKLAATAHALAQGGWGSCAALAGGPGSATTGSALDVAASVRGGTLFTRRFDAAPLISLFGRSALAFSRAVEQAPMPATERLPMPFALGLAFSGNEASTRKLVSAVEEFAMGAARRFAEFVSRTNRACDLLRRGLLAFDFSVAAAAIDEAGGLLERLGTDAGIPLVTDAHREIIALAREQGAAAKISGAGGGDCCVVISRLEDRDRLLASFERRGILLLPVTLARSGVVLHRDVR
jgi:phosphomevalonate kinase